MANPFRLQRFQSPLLFINMKLRVFCLQSAAVSQDSSRKWFVELSGMSDVGEKVNRGGFR